MSWWLQVLVMSVAALIVGCIVLLTRWVIRVWLGPDEDAPEDEDGDVRLPPVLPRPRARPAQPPRLADVVSDECLEAWYSNRPQDVCPLCARVITKLLKERQR
jgi:hypothetical protein